MQIAVRESRGAHAAVLALALLLITVNAFGQNGDLTAVREKAANLMSELRYVEAVPLLKQLADAGSDDPWVYSNLGFALLGKAAAAESEADRRTARADAKKAFNRARELGDDALVIAEIADTLPVDGSSGASFSYNAQAEAFMKKGEAAFVTGKGDEAFEYYQAALKLDPKLYLAALFSGDVKMHGGKFDEAEHWYQTAIKIDPNIETAYRYSATPLMKQGKHDQARDRYIEAFITEPYNRRAVGGLIQWGEVTKTALGHPRVDPPEFNIGPDGKASSTINVNPLGEDGSMAWIGYTSTRSEWQDKKFKELYPGQPYRHTLREEAEAFRSVLSMLKAFKTEPNKLNPQIAVLKQLDEDGLLEAFILIARPDEGIAQDHADYLKDNRAKLRQYVVKYVIAPK
ncbi:MAG TPA: tetratricopeptide repeat protein [Pyrinomonadaceae bacterium]|nr:tetratricopeptide repeat protein [Pyrinomonadaceae bacterium]